MKKILLTSVYFGIFFAASMHQMMAQSFSNFTCPYTDQIKGDWNNGKNNIYPWISKVFPGNWKGQGGLNVDSFDEATIKINGNNSIVTCIYNTDTVDKSKTRSKKTANKEAPPLPGSGRVNYTVTNQVCWFDTKKDSSSCKESIGKCNISCIPIKSEYKCPEPSYLIQHCKTPPGSGWILSGCPGCPRCPQKSLSLLTRWGQGIQISNGNSVTCSYGSNDFGPYTATLSFPQPVRCYFSKPNNSSQQFCNDINKCAIHCKGSSQ